MERTVDFVIAEARRPVRRDRGTGCDLSEVVTERIEFWQPLGEEQDQTIDVHPAEDPTPVEIPGDDVDVTGRGTSTRGSTGLGLDIVRRTAESVGGTIEITRSGRLGGAAVTILVPKAPLRR
jgi:signal transduction histidine kinase